MRAGEADDGDGLEKWDAAKYRAYLLLLAHQLHRNWRHALRDDASDIVQQTWMKVERDLPACRATTEAERRAWLRQILTHTLIDRVRHDGAARRDYRVEQALRQAVDESSARLDKFVASQDSSPSEHVQKQELLLHLAEAIAKLPSRQREVLVCRHFEQLPISKIAAGLELTEKTVAGLLFRARRKLRELLGPFEEN